MHVNPPCRYLHNMDITPPMELLGKTLFGVTSMLSHPQSLISEFLSGFCKAAADQHRKKE